MNTKHSKLNLYSSSCNNQKVLLTPDDLSTLRDQPQLADIDLYHRSLSDDPQGGVEW